MASLSKDIKKYSNWLVMTFARLDINLDYSVKSVELIENYLCEQLEDGKPKNGSYFDGRVGSKLFALSSYLGEVIIKNTSATKWVTNDKDPQGEINIKLVSANGTEMYPAHRVMKRIQNGEEDNLYHYTAIAVKQFMKYEGVIPEDFFPKDDENESKPWWKFW
jgi:hypothetical protein